MNCNIEYFRIEGPVTSTFNNFIKYIVNNREQPISGLAFDGTNLDDTTMRELTQVIYSKPIESTGFRNVIRDTTVDASYNIFLPGHVGKTLKCICIDSAPDINLNLLITRLQNLKVLSITKCNIEIYAVFPLLLNTSISYIDLSGNVCSSCIDTSKMVPTSLERIVISDSSWGSNCLIYLFNYLSQSSSKLSLNLSNSELETNEWKQFYISLRSSKLYIYQK